MDAVHGAPAMLDSNSSTADKVVGGLQRRRFESAAGALLGIVPNQLVLCCAELRAELHLVCRAVPFHVCMRVVVFCFVLGCVANQPQA